MLQRSWAVEADPDGLARSLCGLTGTVWIAEEAGVVLKICRDRAGHLELGLRLAVEVQAATGLATGAWIPTRDGQPTVALPDGRYAVVLHLVPGTILGPARMRGRLEELGALLAAVHGAGEAIGNRLHAWTSGDQEDMVRRAASAPHGWPMAAGLDALTSLRRQVSSRSPSRLLYGDGLEVAAVDGAIAGIIDWGSVSLGAPGWDLAAQAVDCAQAPSGVVDLLDPLVAGYRSAPDGRTGSADLWAHAAACAVLRCASLAAWRWTDLAARQGRQAEWDRAAEGDFVAMRQVAAAVTGDARTPAWLGAPAAAIANLNRFWPPTSVETILLHQPVAAPTSRSQGVPRPIR